MSNVVCFKCSKRRNNKCNCVFTKEQSKEPIYSYNYDLSERINRIKMSIDKINKLMAELKMMTPSRDK